MQITELPVDDTSETTIPSIVTVSQPEEKVERDDKRFEEELIVVEEDEFGEVTVKKSRKPRKKITDKEEITEITEVERTKKITKKKIASHKPTDDEEIIEEETLEALGPFEVHKEHEIILETPNVVSETVPTRQVPEIFNQPAEAQNININIIPLSAVSKEEVLAEEKEQQYNETVPLEFTATKSLSTNEAYQVSEKLSQTSPLTFESTFQPTLSKATRNVTAVESLSVSEVHENQSTSEIFKEKITEDTASVDFILQEATNVIETEAINKEDTFKEATLPKGSTATATYKTSEGISIEQVQDFSTTESLHTEKMTSVTSKINIDAIEPLVVEEIYTDNKPGKHLPEAFVPTEFASSKVIPQKQIIASEMIAPESEGEFIPGRLPPSQTASIDITAAEGLQTQEIQTDDKESSLELSVPQTTTASSELILLEGITVSTTDSQIPSKEIEIEQSNEQRAEVEFLPKQSITTSTVVASEDGKEYVPGELPQSKTAARQITCLEISSVSDVTVQESESSLVQDAKPIMGIAEESIRPVIPLEVSEISTADVPEGFTDYPKYKTQEVTVEFETQAATQITETQTAETETGYEKTTVQSFTLSSTITDAQEELAVTEAKSMECEAELPAFELPSSYKGKQVPTHVFPTSTTEEITAQITASQLSTDTPESGTVNITQTTLDETIISQTVAADSLGTYKEIQEIKGKQADVSVTMSESITITEVLSDDKETDYFSKELPKPYQATIDIDCKKAAHTVEVITNFLPEQLEPEKPQQGQAKPQEELAEGIQILQHQTAEKEDDYKADILPDSKYPTYALETTKNELSVSETYVQESESEYALAEIPKEVLATQNVATQEVAIKSETEMMSHTDDIPEDLPTTGKAKKYARPLQELIVTEATAVDFHKDLPKDIFPNEKKVIVNLIPGQQVMVSEIIAHDKEENLVDSIKPSPKQASTALSTREVALQEETLSHIEPDELKHTSPATDTATAQQDVTHHITQLQLTIAEKESEYKGDVKPDSKFINVEFEEGRSITVLEVQAQDKENLMSIPNVPSSVHGITEFVPCTVAVKTEVATDDSLANIELPTPKLTEANINQTLLEGLIQTETKVEENESQFSENLPETRNAIGNILLDETITVSSIVPADKEKDLEAQELPTSSYAKFDFAEQTTAQTTEVHTGDTLASIDTKTTQEAVATTSHIEHQSLTQSEAIINEAENVLPKDILPDTKVAGLSIDAISAATTEEVMIDEKEKVLPDSEKPIPKSADEHINAQPVAETTVTVLENTVTDLEITDQDKRTANIIQNTFESIVESNVTLGETETIFEKAEFNVKKANVNFSEGKSVDVIEITSADREIERSSEAKPDTQLAVMQLDTIEALQKQEISVHDDISDLTTEQPKSGFAETFIQPYNAIIASESVSQESETNLKQEAKTETKTAVLNIPEDYSVTIESVETAIKESTMETLALPEAKTVETEMTDLKSVATQSEVFSGLSVTDITDKPVSNVNANIENIPFESVTQLQPIVAETESNIPDYETPDSHNVMINVEPWKSLEVFQVTPSDTNEDYRAPAPANQKVADVDVNAGLQVTQTETTLTSEGLDVLEPKKPETFNANETSNLHASLLISQNLVHESEKEFFDKFIAPTSQGEIQVEPGRPAHNITEIVAQEMETELKDVPVGEKKNVSVDFDAHKVAETEEIILQAATDEFEQMHPTQNIANVKTSELEYVVQQQTEICERETDIDVSLKTVPKEADISLQEISSITVSEVRTTEKEKVLKDFEVPKSAQAEKQILQREAAETSEVHSTFGLADFTKEIQKQYSANVKQEYLEGVTSSETVLIESEKPIEDKFTADSKLAEVTITELSSVAVQETYTEDSQQEYQPSQKDLEQATKGYSPLQPLEATSVIASEDVTKLSIAETSPSFVNIQQTTLDSVLLMENVIHEKEVEFGPFEISGTKTANTVLDEQETIGTTEIFVQEKEDMYSTPKKTESQVGTLSVTLQQPLQQQETEAQIALGKLITQKPSTSAALPSHTHLEAVEVSENVLHEQEVKFDTLLPDAKVADIDFLQQKHFSISETLIETKEGILETHLSKDKATAEQEFLQQSAVEVAQVISDQSVSDLSYQTPSTMQPISSTIPHENVIVIDLVFGEKENILRQDEAPKTEMADTSINAAGPVAFTAETTANVKESFLPNYQAPLESAAINVLKQMPIEESEVNALYGLEGLKPDEPTPTRKAVFKQTTLEGITQTEVAVQEKAKYIDTEYEDRRTADLSIVTSESINITEVRVEEQEADKVIVGKATEKSAQPDVQGQTAAVTEETVALQLPDMIDSYQVGELEVKAKEVAAMQYGLVVSEQRSTGELESVPSIQKPDSKKGRILYEDATTTPLISEIQLQEKEGKYLIMSI